MKTRISLSTILTTAILLLISSNLYSAGFDELEKDSVSMEAFYANDVFYNFKNGSVGTASNSNWEIAFYTNVMSAGIITNGARGVDLYTYPIGDTAAWNSIDTTGLSTWPKLYNDENTWEEGAFNRNSFGLFDYGWGVYNMASHNVIGDSIFIIKYGDNTYKKIWIIKKISQQNIYQFKFANLDNSEEVVKEIDVKPYNTKNFIYYSLSDDALIDREPSSDSWDILFTKYMGLQPNGVYYPVTGVLNNLDVFANEYDEVAPDYSDWSVMPFDTTISTMGWDWKHFDMDLMEYVLTDSLAYFVKNLDQEVYKLVFTGFVGSSNGKVYFDKSMLSGTSIDDNSGLEDLFVVSPIPASNYLNILFLENSDDPLEIIMYDITGKKVYDHMLPVHFGSTQHQIPVRDLNNGLYVLILQSGNRMVSKKVMIN